MTHESALLRTALAAADEDLIIYDLDAVEERYTALRCELPQVAVRFAVKACPVDGVLAALAGRGAGFDAASTEEIRQAFRAGARPGEVHYGNTVKSDRDIAEAYRLGVRDFATDSLQDVAAIGVHAPGSRVFCRLATDGEGALWGLSRKYGCSPQDALLVMAAARAAGLVPAGLSVHVGSQQMTTAAWQAAFDRLAGTLTALNRRGIRPDHVNIGGGLPALGYLDRHGQPLEPALDAILAVIRQGVRHLREVSAGPLDFVMEPGRHLVADAGAIRAQVVRLTVRQQLEGERESWLYLSCGKFNGLYEMDALQFRLVFPTHPDPARPGADSVPAVLAGPTCDSDDAYSSEHSPVLVPRTLASGDPVWVLSTGAYATSYLTQGFNGFRPLGHSCVRGEPGNRPPGSGPSTRPEPCEEEAAWATV
jgi:ornithine decarboxylase